MTRPRMAGSELSWRVVLAVARKSITAVPTATSRTQVSHAVGATAVTRSRPPKAMPDPISRRRVGRDRLAA